MERREEESADIIIREAVFTWSAHPDEEHEHFKLLVEQELRFQPGVINLILGPTGSGKTSLLMALLSTLWIALRDDITNTTYTSIQARCITSLGHLPRS